ncbi:MAG: hypothetical protein HYY84_12770 [Deltaproteobacteria bacterium]|nr:hypothetical protein [Deltaproteobacteria bacterium]
MNIKPLTLPLIVLALATVPGLASAASDIDCTNKINPNTMTQRDCMATGWGTNACKFLLERRAKGARYRTLNDIVNMVRLKYGNDESKCVKRRGESFKTWIWPKAACEMTKKSERCDKKSGNMCPRRVEAGGDFSTCSENPM